MNTSLILAAALLAPAPESEPADAVAEPESPVLEPDPEAPIEGDGLRTGFARKDPVWVPNTWPQQQRCHFGPGSHSTCLTLRGEVFAGYRYSATSSDSFNEFRLDRAEVGTGLVWQANPKLEAGATIGIEAVRSAGPQSLIGIDGDSLVSRLLEAYGQAVVHAGPIDIGARMGVVPERWVEQVNKGTDIRGLQPIGSESALMFDRSDLGATLTVSGWKSLVELDVEFVNGEGRAQKELNRGKNTTAIATVRPLRRRLDRGPMTLSVHGGYRDGSIGIGTARNHRGMAAVTFASPWVYGGFEYAHAMGYLARGEITADTLGGWASAHVWAPWLGVLASYDHTRQDTGESGATIDRVSAGVFGDVFPQLDRNRRRVRLYAAYQYEGYGNAAAPLPGTPDAVTTHRFLMQLQVRGLVRAH